jgi:type VI secretion system secreted protein Hcp
MALNAYLTLAGQNQGPIQGSVTQKGREGKIMVIAVEHELLSPHDAASGLATGKRMHKPFVVTKELDKSSPLLRTAWANNEIFSTWELQFWTANRVGTAASASGVEKQHYTVKLSGARLISIHFHMLNNKNPELARYTEFEELAFAYQKIDWTWVATGATSSDTWGSARAARRAPAGSPRTRAKKT